MGSVAEIADAFGEPFQVTAMNRNAIPIFASILALSVCSVASAREASQVELMKQAKVTQDAARETALAKVPGGTVKSAELEKEHGKLVWSFDIAQAGTKNITEVLVDANSGAIVATELETPKKEAKEAAAEAHEKKH